jgi:hypothetical protein
VYRRRVHVFPEDHKKKKQTSPLTSSLRIPMSNLPKFSSRHWRSSHCASRAIASAAMTFVAGRNRNRPAHERPSQARDLRCPGRHQISPRPISRSGCAPS